MKKIYFLLLFFCISVSSTFSQNNPTTKNTYLPTSSTESQVALIYKLKESKKIFQNEDIIELLDKNKTDLTSFITLVDSVETNKLNEFNFSNSMEYGYYLTVWTEKEILKVKLTTIAPLNVVLQSNAKRAWLIVYDSLGNELPHLKIKLDNQILSYNKKLKSYTLPNRKKTANIEIEYAEQTWHLLAQRQNNNKRKRSFIKKIVYSFPVKYFWIVPYRQAKKIIRTIDYGEPEDLGLIRFFIKIFTKDDEDDNYSNYANFNGYPSENGYIVTDKLKYRPLDTLRFKTYLVNKKGKPISDNEIDIFIATDRNTYKKLHAVKAYRKGGFESEFILADSLKLKLGNFAGIILKDKKGKILVSQRINYQDYILPEIKSFEVESSDESHFRNTPFSLRITAKDFNNLNVLDGKIKIELETKHLKTTYEPSITQNQITWKHEQNLEPFGETIIHIPDSIFPAADLLYDVKAVLHNSNNERLEETLSINYEYFTKKPNLEARFEDGFVYAVYREGKDTVSKKGFVYRYFTDNFGHQTIKKDSIEFPFKEKVNAIYSRFNFLVNISEYKSDGYNFLTQDVSIPNSLSMSGYYLQDSLIMTIQNPFKTMVRYSLFCKNNLINKKADSSSIIRIAIKDKHKKIYTLQTTYTFAGQTKYDKQVFLRNRKQLFVSLDAPLLTSPSFKEKINVTVTDYKKRPVKNADLTVLATNGKFDDYTKVNISNTLTSRFRFKKKKKLADIYLKNQGVRTKNLGYYPNWQNRFGLDSIAYYNFIFPKKKGFRFSVSYQKLQDSLLTKLKNVNAEKYRINLLKESFDINHNPNTGALFPFFFTQKGYEDIAWIKIDDSLAYLSNANVYQDHLITLSEGIHKLEVRLRYSIITIDTISVPIGSETILSFDLDNLPSYLHKKNAGLEVSNEEKLMLGSHAFFGITYGDSRLNEGMTIQQGANPPQRISSKYKSIRNDSVNTYHYEWHFPLLNKGEFRVLRDRRTKWDTLYFEPFVGYNFEEGKYIEVDSILLKEYQKVRSTTEKITFYYEGGEITKIDTLSKSFFSSQKYVSANTDKSLFYNNYVFPFFDYSAYKIQKSAPYLYEWTTPQFQVISRHWNKLTFKNIDSLSENFEKEYFFRNLIPFKGKLPAGTYQIFVFYNSYGGNKCQKINNFKMDDKNPSVKIIDFEKMGINCYERERNQDSTQLQEIEEIETSYQSQTITDYYNDYDFVRNGKLYRGKVFDGIGETLPGATVIIKGTNRGTVTDMEGNYSIIAPVGSILVFQYIGFESVEKTTTPYDVWLDVNMNESSQLLESVVVASYSPSRTRNSASYSVSVVDALSGSASGVQLSNNRLQLSNSLNLETKSLDLEDSVTQQKKKNIRNYFTDNAIWQPTLRTDENGKASFEATYPDDITSWKTLAIAYGKKNKNGQALVQTNSFLTLSAQLSLPRFLIEGDSVRIIGKIASYSSDSVKVNTFFDLKENKIQKGERNVLFSSVDSLRFSVADNSEKTQNFSIDSLNNLQDSLTVQYVMNADISEKQIYTDGEERKIPIFKKGLTQSRGFFAVLEGDTTLDLRAFKDSLSTQNPVRLYVKDNILEAMVSELEHIQNYAYACNEQKASKIRAYILEKDIKTALDLPFEKKKQKELDELIKKLVEAQYEDGWWGWWATSAPNAHMTAYIYGVLFDAKEKDYEIPSETLSKAEKVLRDDLSIRMDNEQVEIYTALSKNKTYQKIYKSSVERLAIALQIQEDTAKYHSFYNQLSILRLRQLYDLPISLRILEVKQKKTLFGGIFWQEYDYKGYYSLFQNNVQTNLLAYQILRDAKGKNTPSIDLAKVRQYFLESRNQNGYWRSTHESASILSTILPDFESKSKNPSNIEITANNKTINTESDYLFSRENLPNQLVKKGLAPVFVSLSQQYFLPQVTQKTSDNFHIKTYFKNEKSKKITELKSDSIYITAGKPIILTIEVTAQKESEYVSIEVPIPASCVYGKNPYSFRQNYYYYYRGIETYREEFKHKTAIFCTKMPIGTHTFEIILEPRYSGVFTLNPASVELMYFPSVKGNEGTKKVFVK
ncbi:alpha-2-macroglobulin family protein [Bernardetia sp. Wsw4-3y2]|uniref:carboxypeptidase-like regulatory domain-containing protein n=1 Tax=Bernardetia sp. Wsw4-3y2 TaxID=3127471 RepID=UPI0030CB9463